MPVKSSIALLLHLLLAGWIGQVVSGLSIGVRHGQDISPKKIHDSLITHMRKPRNVYEQSDIIDPQEQPPLLSIRQTPKVKSDIELMDSFVVECGAFGRPSPAIHWLKDGNQVRQDDFLFTNALPSDIQTSPFGLSMTKSRLYIDCMAPTDEGVYTCVADTPYLRVSEPVNVFLSPEIRVGRIPSCPLQERPLVRGHRGQPARIHMWTTRLLQNMGNDGVLFCRAIGHPTPSIEWTLSNGRPLLNSSKYQLLDNGDLLIRRAVWSDMGGYNCVAKNLFGNDTTSSFFYPMANEDK